MTWGYTLPTPTATPIPTSTPTPKIVQVSNGLLGTYYNTVNLSGSSVVRYDSTINFNWGFNAPHSGIDADTFSVRWTGYVVPQYSQTYRFYATTDDGVRLWVNNQRIINNWTLQGATEVSGAIYLTAGQKYPIKMEFYDNAKHAVAKLRWSSQTQPKQIIPSNRLFRP